MKPRDESSNKQNDISLNEVTEFEYKVLKLVYSHHCPIGEREIRNTLEKFRHCWSE
jgi:hypothetical protein